MRELVALGALPAGEEGLGPRAVRRARLLHSWAAAGLSVETILALVERGALSLAFLQALHQRRPPTDPPTARPASSPWGRSP